MLSTFTLCFPTIFLLRVFYIALAPQPLICDEDYRLRETVTNIKLGGDCPNDYTCEAIAFCDINGICMPKPGQPCSGKKGQPCSSKSVCAEDHICRVELYGECNFQDNGGYCLPDLVCDEYICKRGVLHSCVGMRGEPCSTVSTCDVDDKCRLNTKEECKDTSYCVTGNICQKKACWRKEGWSCAQDNIFFCQEGTACDIRRLCRRRPGQACETAEECVAGALCRDKACQCDDTISEPGYSAFGEDICLPFDKAPGGMCKAIEGNQTCSDPNSNCTKLKDAFLPSCECVYPKVLTHGLKCENPKGKVGGRCSPNIKSQGCADPYAKCEQDKKVKTDYFCQCMDGYIKIEDLTCKGGLGVTCTKDPDICMEGLTCSADIKNYPESICQLSLGSPCKDKPSMCTTFAICDDTYHCGLIKNIPCGGARKNCRNGYVCDIFNFCRVEVGGPCSPIRPNDCIGGSKCIAETCQCDSKISVQVDNMCRPKPGFVKGSCKYNLDCFDIYASCLNNTCVCSSLTRYYSLTCMLPLGSSTLNLDKVNSFVMILGSSLVLIGLMTLVGFLSSFIKMRKSNDLNE